MNWDQTGHDPVGGMMMFWPRIVLIASLSAFCWLAMQAVHELGHVLAAWCTGGEVLEVVLKPWVISRTDVGTNPHPAVVVWAGPVVGVLLPLLLWGIAAALKVPMTYLLRFFAAFCLVANGVYIAFGPSDTGMDTEVMLIHGATRGWLLAFGLPCLLLGLYLWHGQGRHFGFGEADGKVESRAVWVSCAALVIVITAELLAF